MFAGSSVAVVKRFSVFDCRGNTAPFGGGGVLFWEIGFAPPEIPEDMMNCESTNLAAYGPCVGRLCETILYFNALSIAKKLKIRSAHEGRIRVKYLLRACQYLP